MSARTDCKEQTITGDTPKSQRVTIGGFFAGRVYAPSAMSGSKYLSVFFAGYHTPQPKKARAIAAPLGRISLYSVPSPIPIVSHHRRHQQQRRRRYFPSPDAAPRLLKNAVNSSPCAI
jgi:hypothetical protein